MASAGLQAGSGEWLTGNDGERLPAARWERRGRRGVKFGASRLHSFKTDLWSVDDSEAGPEPTLASAASAPGTRLYGAPGLAEMAAPSRDAGLFGRSGEASWRMGPLG